MKKIFLILGISLFMISYSTSQTSINAGGGDFKNADVTYSYSIGQIFYGAGVLHEGVQIPYNIFEVTGIEDVKDIFLNMSVFPNPTSDFLELRIEKEDFDYKNVNYQISDNNGRIVKSNEIINFQTFISMENLPSGIYFLVVKTKLNTVKTFKIVKN